MMETTQTLPDRIGRNVQECNFEACISDYESSNKKDNLDQNYSSLLHW